ncbi:cytochrome c oxidase, cbb3-type, subunit III [Luteitalea pratensis]|uniref:Cytochrome c oxidase, cbb3-type, subunit III n=1 Tax=Luteitalea pratensis TaxID=1855912 RepID=A0A143PM64_LUTPR|nr:c-type cytochrome [Luteitalea pratensis]AMY09687.1 cytochrome c oxidase, cbb3-type, subunit III [Luteitalea pratensis]
MLNARTVGAVCVALVMIAGTGRSLVMAQAAKKKAAPKAAGGPAPTAEEVASAEEIYKTKCAVCHTLEGNSPIPNMNFADGAWLHGSTVKDVVNTISNGIQGTAMMPFKTQFSEGEIAALARKVRSFDPKLK